MMHLNDFVVSIKLGEKPVKEYKTTKSETKDTRIRKIFVPFHAEYNIMLSNMKWCRRRIEIEMDGCDIGSWVIDKGSKNSPTKVHIERFLDENKKFKLVPSDHPDVDDPTNENNGMVIVSVFDEKPDYHLTAIPFEWPKQPYNPYPPQVPTYPPPFAPMWHVTNSCHANVESSSYNAATIAGSISNQQFTKTSWNGDACRSATFKFLIIGKDKLTNYCSDCGVKIVPTSNFCHHCGVNINAA